MDLLPWGSKLTYSRGGGVYAFIDTPLMDCLQGTNPIPFENVGGACPNESELTTLGSELACSMLNAEGGGGLLCPH
jgi:hypothetical protein